MIILDSSCPDTVGWGAEDTCLAGVFLGLPGSYRHLWDTYLPTIAQLKCLPQAPGISSSTTLLALPEFTGAAM